jgi:hypothetical protein
MNEKSETVRVTIDFPKELHKKLKTLAAISGKSIRDLVTGHLNNIINEACGCSDECVPCPYSHIPNEETLESLKNIKQGKNLTKIGNLEALAKKLGL